MLAILLWPTNEHGVQAASHVRSQIVDRKHSKYFIQFLLLKDWIHHNGIETEAGCRWTATTRFANVNITQPYCKVLPYKLCKDTKNKWCHRWDRSEQAAKFTSYSIRMDEAGLLSRNLVAVLMRLFWKTFSMMCYFAMLISGEIWVGWWGWHEESAVTWKYSNVLEWF